MLQNDVRIGASDNKILYSTDLSAADNVEVAHGFDPSLHDEIVYVLVLLKSSEEHPGAKAFYDYLRSSKAGAVYTRYGFRLINHDAK